MVATAGSAGSAGSVEQVLVHDDQGDVLDVAGHEFKDVRVEFVVGRGQQNARHQATQGMVLRLRERTERTERTERREREREREKEREKRESERERERRERGTERAEKSGC